MSINLNDRILVTGGGGFLGSFVVEKLKARGYQDIVVPRRKKYRFDSRSGCRTPLWRIQTGGGAAPSRRGRRHRRQSRESRPVFLRQCRDGHSSDRRGTQERDQEVPSGRHHLRLPEIHSRPLSRIRPLERIPRGNQRPLRHRQEGTAGNVPIVSPAVRPQCGLPAPGESCTARATISIFTPHTSFPP